MLAPQGQPVSNLVKVSIILASAPAQGENVDTMLILGSSAVIDVVTRMRTYTNLADIANDFGTTAPEYLAATVWFEQSPQPVNLNIGRWVKDVIQPPQLFGGPQVGLLYSQFTGTSSGALELFFGQRTVALTGMDFSGVTNLNGVASIIQAALRTASSDAALTVVWDAVYSRFVITGSAGVNANLIGFAQAGPTTSAVGTVTSLNNPANNDTLTLNGTVITFVTGTPSGSQVQIGVSEQATMAALLVFLQESADTQLVKFKYTLTSTGGGHWVIGLAATTPGTGGNSLTLVKSSTALIVSGATLTGGSANNIGDLMGLTAATSGAYIAPLANPETMLAATVLLDDMYSNQWYGYAALGGANADYLAVAAYLEGSLVKHYQICTDQEGACILPNDTSSLMYQLNQLKYNKTACQYSSTSPYAGISYLARILTTNWLGSNTTITLQFKTEPGVVGERLSTSSLNAILAKKGSVYIDYNNGTTIIQGATSASGQYTDTIIGTDWLAITIMQDVYNLLYTTPTKVPQTDAGMNMIHAVLDADMAEAANNGLVAPGTWTLPGFGALQYGEYLPKGYYIYQPPVAQQSPADRQARKSVPFQIAAKLAGAVHEADISVTVNQ